MKYNPISFFALHGNVNTAVAFSNKGHKKNLTESDCLTKELKEVAIAFYPLRYVLLFSIIFLLTDCFAQSGSAVIKSIHVAEYNAEREPNVSRESALSDKVSEVKFFDASGNMSKHTRYQTKEMIYETTNISWSKDSLVQTRTVFDGEGNLKSTWESTWKSKGHILGATNKGPDGVVTLIQINEHDKNGNMVLRKMENVGSNKIGTTSFTYDVNGNVIEEVQYNPYRDKTVKRTYQYDDLGNEILQEIFNGGNNYTKLVSENDEKGNLVEQYWYDKDGDIKSQTSFSYVYDMHGNWTTKKRSTNGVLSYVWERKIEY